MKKHVVILGLLMFQLGCASVPADQRVPEDPLESINRSIFKFNAGLDKAILKPVAKGYRAVMPGFAETGVSNFFSNLDDVPTAVNNLLQGKVKAAGSDSLRFLLNSTVGIGGLIDVAGPAGLNKHNEDFGQTLGVWGVSSGPYLVLPVLGPSTVRDTIASPVDYYADPRRYVDQAPVTDRLNILEIIDTRSNLIDAEELLGSGLYDNYQQLREIYITRRNRAIADGVEAEDAGEDLRNELEDLDE